MADLQALDCEDQVAGNGTKGHGIPNDQAVAPSREPSERRIEPLSDEWFEDLDKSIDEITRLFEEMRVAPPEPEDAEHIQHAQDGLAAIEKDLTNCFTNLESLKRRFGGGGRRKSSAFSSCPNDDLYRPFRPRSMDLGATKRIRKTKSRPGHRKSLPGVDSYLSEAIIKHLEEW